jgi:hypothetical protein
VTWTRIAIQNGVLAMPMVSGLVLSIHIAASSIKMLMGNTAR